MTLTKRFTIESLDHSKAKEIDPSSLPLKITIEPSEDGEGAIVKAETYLGRSTWIFSMKHLLKIHAKHYMNTNGQ